MKKTFVLILGSVLLCTPLFSQTAQEEAIKKVCMAESQAFANSDYDAYATYHAQTADDQLVLNNPNGSFSSWTGWEAVSNTVKMFTQGGKKENAGKVFAEHFSIVIRGDMAFAAYDGRFEGSDGKTTKTRENRTLLLMAGQWKILAVQVYIDHTAGK